MFQKILIANRGEIAVRIIQACREMEIPTVAVYSEADREALPALLADEAVCIGPAPSGESYLNRERILSTAVAVGADAIHPGFGFLSENSKFAEMCEKCRIRFIGPGSEVIARMGNKAEARNTMTAAGVPVVPGTKEPVYTVEEGRAAAEDIGYPVMIKAAAGGGGRGMRVAEHADEFEAQFSTAQREAEKGFSDHTMYLERFVKNPRHVEFQILADAYGNVIHLGERDCSVQRRHQKMVEESPSPALTPALREEMGKAAVKAAKAAGYENAGTVEFLLAEDGTYYFMEMNTRIQVEHPVTETVTGLDLVKEQIRIAAGEKLRFTQEEIHLSGHSLECRINAENPEKNFRPCPGVLTDIHLPGGNGVRVDTAIYNGYRIPPYYDSMIAKLIVHGEDRREAIRKMERALEELVIEGVETTQEYQLKIIGHPVFQAGKQDTSFIEKYLEDDGVC
ncbi:acetyl-CoA carboxylase biotin carboxylase subunit [Cuneatibacter sp. NSJ-177]|uniref:acetyl-CoA carboxylase biotin carboxylase subunit n=1 Tax=Cuneatibacter sp. NSJ-177 TaxID=2931401 RepID=UPI001FD4C0D9|nr:acetyl-CoA carboxylase biotin carboxylase subunit [Cuneatibacter sp. NSJ-177]MCJ7835199.1 acetyl-CoA carboxylase biotin carboxylase subunit [Cuneatibacter sp. NSJ-177]